jgi:hypothetical protein
MAENDLDSGQSQGTSQNTNSGGSAGNGDKQSSFDAAKLQSTLEALGRKLDEVDARSKALQGDKDRDVKSTKKEVQELKRQIAEIEKLKSAGLEPDAAVEEHRGLREQLNKLNPASNQPAGNGASGADERTRLIEELKLDGNDPKVMQAVRDEADFAKLAARLVTIKATAPPPPDPALAPPMQGSPAAPADAKQLIGDYQKEMLAVKRGDKTTLTQIKEKYRKLGVPVDTIAFV